jgi:AraC-like DNA-binding protein
MAHGTDGEVVLCLLPHRHAVQRIEAAVRVLSRRGRSSLVVRSARDWRELRSASEVLSPRLVVVDPRRLKDGRGAPEAIARLRRLLRGVPLVAWATKKPLPPRIWIALRELGVTVVIQEGEDDHPFAIALALERALGAARGEVAVASLADALPGWVVNLLERAYPRAHRGLVDEGEPALTTEVLAALWMTGATPRQLRYRFAREGLPPPGWFCRWLIALRAASLREALGTWEQVAYVLEFDSSRDLRRFVRRLTGAPPSELTVERLVEFFRSVVQAGPAGDQEGTASP